MSRADVLNGLQMQICISLELNVGTLFTDGSLEEICFLKNLIVFSFFFFKESFEFENVGDRYVSFFRMVDNGIFLSVGRTLNTLYSFLLSDI